MYVLSRKYVGNPYLILGLAYMLIVYLQIIRPHYNAITIKLYINTDHASTMEIYPPVPELGHTAENVKRIGFPKGESGHLFSVRYVKTSMPLRLDPTFKNGLFVINSMSVEHLGFTKTIDDSDFEQYVTLCDQAICQSTGDGFSIESTGKDAKVFLRPAIVPFLSLSGLIAIILCLYLVPITLYRYLDASQSKYPAATRHKTIIRALLVYLVVNYFTHGNAPIFGAILNTFALTLVVVYGLISLNNFKFTGSQKSESYIILFSAVVLLMFGFSQSFTFTFLDDLRENLTSVPAEKDLRKQFEKYRSDIEKVYINHFYGKDTLINIDAKAKIFGLGFTPNTKSILGQDGWFFEGYGSRRVEKGVVKSYDNITDYMGLLPFSSEELEQWRVVLEERYYWLKERGIDYIFALAPTKALIYPEKLPERILKLKNSLKYDTRYDQLVQYLKKYSVVPVVDLKTALWEAKETHAWPLYYRTDFHWNYLGSFFAYNAILDVINERMPEYELQNLTLGEFRIEQNNNWAHHAFLKMVGLVPQEHKNDTYLTLYPKNHDRYDDNSVFHRKGIYDRTMPDLSVVEFGENSTRAAMREIGNNKGKLDGIFLIGDSFSEKMIGYFSAHAKTVYNYRTVSRFLTEPIELYKPQIVIQEILNMYILRAPPVNPPELKMARGKYIKEAE